MQYPNAQFNASEGNEKGSSGHLSIVAVAPGTRASSGDDSAGVSNNSRSAQNDVDHSSQGTRQFEPGSTEGLQGEQGCMGKSNFRRKNYACYSCYCWYLSTIHL